MTMIIHRGDILHLVSVCDNFAQQILAKHNIRVVAEKDIKGL